MGSKINGSLRAAAKCGVKMMVATVGTAHERPNSDSDQGAGAGSSQGASRDDHRSAGCGRFTEMVLETIRLAKETELDLTVSLASDDNGSFAKKIKHSVRP